MSDVNMEQMPDLGRFVDWVWNLKAERDQLREERDSLESECSRVTGQNARLHDQIVELYQDRDQLRAELDAIRGQEPVAWCVPVAGEYEIGVDREKVQFQRDMYERIMSDEIEHEEAQPLYALPPQHPDAVSVPRELLEAGQMIRTQDNRCTDAPLFAVMKKQAIVTSPDHDYDYIEWVNVDDDYAVASDTKARRLEALYDGCRDVPEGWERFAMKEIDVFVTACFTEQGCKDFLARDGHNHRKPFIYAFGSYRNAEFRAIREWLAALPSTRQAEEGE
ncbi:hypothetical protein L682_30025 [Aquipseudomonas alcaligenes OT 69]|nr:hypothetical protein L682_30025 [Pseudomonas alcaligenes OT 69]